MTMLPDLPKVTDAPSAPTAEEYLQIIAELAPQIEEAAAKADVTGRFDAELHDELRARGLFEFLKPRELGGSDLTPFEALRVLGEVSRLDVSTAWNLMVQNANLKYLEMMSRESALELYEGGAPRIAGSVAPSGVAVQTEGGYRITGRWGYASTYPNADIVVGAARVQTAEGEPVLAEDGSAVTLMFLTPKENSVEEGNWDVMGLKASGSVDHSVTDVFVPTDRTILNGYVGTKPIWGGTSALVGFAGWLVWCHTAIEIGAGRRVLDEMRAHASHESYRKGTAAKSEFFRDGYAKAESDYRAARAWVLEVWREVDATILAGEEMTTQQLTDSRAALLQMNRVNQRNAQFVFVEIGGSAIRPGVVQRFYRDVMTASTHVQVNRKFLQGIAQVYLSGPDGYRWTPHALIPVTD